MKSHSFSDVQSLMAIANDPTLQAAERPVYVHDDDTTFVDTDPGEIEGMAQNETGEAEALRRSASHKQVYNPETGRQFDVVTDEYEIINPPAFLGPLCEQLNERDRDDVTGTIRRYDGGARCYAEVLFEETDAVYLEGRPRSNPVRVGFNVEWSHDGGLSVKVRGFAQDTACTNSIRQVTSPIHVKHAGDVDSRIDWTEEWAEVLDELGAFSERLAQIIESARATALLDFRSGPRWSEVTDPLDLLSAVEMPGPLGTDARRQAYDFYELMGLPSYLAVEATDRLATRLATRDDPRTASAWDVYSGATYALTHEFRGDVGRSDGDKHRLVREILLNPELAKDDAKAECARRRQEAAESESGDGISLGGAVDAEADVDDDMREALQTESERSRELEFGG